MGEALEFYADRDNWTIVSDQKCSTMMGPDDHDNYIKGNKRSFTGGSIARKSLSKWREGSGDE